MTEVSFKRVLKTDLPFSTLLIIGLLFPSGLFNRAIHDEPMTIVDTS